MSHLLFGLDMSPGMWVWAVGEGGTESGAGAGVRGSSGCQDILSEVQSPCDV